MYNDENYEEENTEEEQSSGSKIREIYENNKKLVWILGIIILLIIVASLFSGKGGSSSGGGGGNNYVKAVNDPETVQLMRTKELKLKINNTEYYGAIDSSRFAFTPQNSNIADIDSSGMIIGKGIGSTVIKGSYTENGKQYTFDVRVVVFNGNENVKLQSADFNNRSVVMSPVHDMSLSNKLNVTPEDGYVYDVMYSSSDPTTVAVDESGTVKGLRPGSATIAARINGGSTTATIDVYIIEDVLEPALIKVPQKIEFEAGASTKVPIGGVLTELKLSLSPSDSSSKYISWKSSDDSVVAVTEDGMVSGIKEGTATITATALNGKQGKIIVEASQDVTDIESITLPQSSISLKAGESKVITPTIKPDNAGTKSLTFESNNPSVATVVPSQTKTSATITAGTAGKAVITVKSANGKSATLVVNVTGNSGGGGNNGGGQVSDDGSVIRVRLGGSNNVPGKKCNNDTVEYYKGPLKATISGSASYVSYCFGKDCTPPDSKMERLSNGTVTIEPEIEAGKTLILRVRKYNSSKKEIASSNNGNYVNGALEYYINTKESGLVCKSRDTWENGGTSGTGTHTCYVKLTYDKKQSNDFEWKEKGTYLDYDQTVITSPDDCKQANNNSNGTKNLCFRNGSTYCFGSDCSVKGSYTYVSSIEKKTECTSNISTSKKLEKITFYDESGKEIKNLGNVNIKKDETIKIKIELTPSSIDDKVTITPKIGVFTINGSSNSLDISNTRTISIKGVGVGQGDLQVSSSTMSYHLLINVTNNESQQQTQGQIVEKTKSVIEIKVKDENDPFLRGSYRRVMVSASNTGQFNISLPEKKEVISISKGSTTSVDVPHTQYEVILFGKKTGSEEVKFTFVPKDNNKYSEATVTKSFTVVTNA